MIMKLALLLLSVLSVSAYVLPGPVTRPPQRSSLVMNEAPKPPKKDYMLTLNGGVRTVADVYADQKKAAKKYEGKDVTHGGYNAGGWTTNKVK